MDKCEIFSEEKTLLVLRTNLKKLLEQKEKAIQEIMETKKASNYDRKLFSMKHYKSISPQEIKEGFAKYFMPTPTAASLASIEENKGCSEVGYPDPEDEDDMNDVDEFEKKGDAPMISPKIFRGLKTKFRLDSPQCTAPELHPIPLSKFHWNNAIVNLSCIYKY